MRIKTYSELKVALQSWLSSTEPSENAITTDEDVLRFVAVQHANEYAELNRRELVNMVVSGLPAMDQEMVQEWLDTVNDYEVGDEAPDWVGMFEDFYGPKQPDPDVQDRTPANPLTVQAAVRAAVNAVRAAVNAWIDSAPEDERDIDLERVLIEEGVINAGEAIAEIVADEVSEIFVVLECGTSLVLDGETGEVSVA